MSLFAQGSRGRDLFKNEDSLDPEWIPKELPFRENQQHALAACIKPLLDARNGRNAFIFGSPGIGKTAAVQWVLRDLEEQTDDIRQCYVNCWQANTTYKVYVELCHQLGYIATPNKNSEQLLDVIKTIGNKGPCVLAFDEIDKAEDLGFLYSVLNELFKKTIIIVTNEPEWLAQLEQRILSRLLAQQIEFKPYNLQETKEILKKRIGYAFTSNAWSADAVDAVAAKSTALHDLRSGLFLVREAGRAAGERAAAKVELKDAEAALSRLPQFAPKRSDELMEDERLVLKAAREKSGKAIGEIFSYYESSGGKSNYRTFQRRIQKLQIARLVLTERAYLGKEGNTTLVKAVKAQEKETLKDFA